MHNYGVDISMRWIKVNRSSSVPCPCWHVALGLEEIRGPDPRTHPLLCPADTELVQMPLIRGLVP